MSEASMRNLGDRALLFRLIAAGVVLLLVLWTFLAPPAHGQGQEQGRGQPLGGARAGAPLAAEPELPASDLMIRFESPALRFRWSLAPEAALEPALVRAVRTEALAERERARREAEADAANPPPGKGVTQYQWGERWAAEAETDALLALSARRTSFTGGAHGNLIFRSMLWDRGAEKAIGFADLFADPKAMAAALKPAFCQALEAERAERRRGQPRGKPGDMFETCPDPMAYPIVPVGDGRVHSVRVLVPPYEAGPWSEGAYEIGLDAALVRPFVAPRFAAAFAKP